MCKHETVALIQENLKPGEPKKYYCFSCHKIITTLLKTPGQCIDMRYTPIEIVKKRFL